jgi:hypothetical protein
MKKILVFVLCALLIVALPTVAYAQEIPEETTTETTETVPEESMTDIVTGWIQENFEEISVIGTLLSVIFYEVRKHRSLNGTIGTLNNNAIKVAENSASTIKEMLTEAQDIAKVVTAYKDEFALLLGEVRKSAEEKRGLEETLNHVEAFLKSAKLATLELSNEVADLLVLANIPNSKKEELYSRHTQAVHAIEAMEEAIGNDGSEA